MHSVWACIVQVASHKTTFTTDSQEGGITALTRHGFPAERMWHLQVVNSQNAGLLPFLPAAADEYDPVSGAKLKPFLLLVGCQAVLYVAAFLLSRGNGRVAKSKEREGAQAHSQKLRRD